MDSTPHNARGKRPVYELRIESLPGFPIPASARLKQWLKIGLRGLGLRCIWAREIENDQPEALGELVPVVLNAIAARETGS